MSFASRVLPALFFVILASPTAATAASMGASGRPCLLPGSSGSSTERRGGARMRGLVPVQNRSGFGRGYGAGAPPRGYGSGAGEGDPSGYGAQRGYPYAPGMMPGYGPGMMPGAPGLYGGAGRGEEPQGRAGYGPAPRYREGGGMGMGQSGRPASQQRQAPRGTAMPGYGGGYPWSMPAGTMPGRGTGGQGAPAMPTAGRWQAAPAGVHAPEPATGAPRGDTVTPYSGPMNDPWAADDQNIIR